MGCPCKRSKKAGEGAEATVRLIPMIYQGEREYGFEVQGGVTRERYCVPADDGKHKRLVCLLATKLPGVHPADVPWFRSVNRGKDYALYVEPAPEPVVEIDAEAEHD